MEEKTAVATFDDKPKFSRLRVVGDFSSEDLGSIAKSHELYSFNPKEGAKPGQMSILVDTEEKAKVFYSNLVPELKALGYTMAYQERKTEENQPDK